MASEIRVNSIKNRSGLGTITVSDSGAVFSGVTTFAQIQTTSGEITVGTGASVFSPATNVLALGTDNAERVRITSTGRVGIGTDNPQRQFHIFGNSGAIIHRTGGDPQLVLRSDYYDVDGTEWRFRVVSGDGRFVLRRQNQSTSLETLTINNSDGKIGVNQETPQRQLHVKSGANSNDGAFRIESSTNNIMDIGTDGTGHFLNCVNTDPFRIKFAGSEKVRIDSSGNVGIGTNNPGAILEVFGPTTSTMYIKGGGGGSDPARKATLGLYASGNKIYNLRADASDGSFQILDSSTERLRIEQNGNVGIGTVPQSWSGFRSLQLGGTTSIWSVEGGQAGSSFYSNNIYFDGSNRRYLTNNSASEYIQDASTGNHIFYEASSGTAGNTLSGYTEIARFTSNGLKVPSGSGIDFSATSDAGGMTSELLDDYEEGTWTPSVTFGGGSTGVTYSSYNRGWYAKIGRVVVVKLALEVTNKGTSTGSAAIGLPFSSSLVSSSHAQVVGTNKINSTTTMAYGTASPGFNLYKVNPSTSANFIAVTDADCGTSFSVIASLTYMV